MTTDQRQPRRGRPGDRPDWRQVSAGLGLSLVFHGLVVAALVLSVVWASTEETEETEEVEFQDVDLLAIGEEPDPDSLPRLTGDEGTPPEAADVQPDPEVEPEPQPQPEPEPDPEPDEDAEQLERQRQEEEARRQQQEEQRRQERQRRMDEALGRFEEEGRGDEAPEGHPDGVAGGTVTDPDEADMFETYTVRVLQAIERHWEIPAFLSESEIDDLAGQVEVGVRLTDDGHIDRLDFRTNSDNRHFDDSVERALRQFKADEGGEALPLPEDDEIRRGVLDQGLVLRNWERL